MTGDVHENKMRRMADRQGLILRKSRRRDPRAVDYGVYWLVDKQTNSIQSPEMTIGEVEAYLTK